MKTRAAIVALTSLVMSLPILSFDATSKSAASQGRKVILTAKVTDENNAPITAAHISVFHGEQHLGEKDTDARGIAQIEINLNTSDAVALVLEVSKPGLQTKQHKMKLRANSPLRLPIEDITLHPGVGDDQFLLTIKAVDKEGNRIKGALINIYRGDYKLGADSIVRPPLLQQITNADGMKDFEIPVKPGQDFKIEVEVSREDMQTERRTVTIRTNLIPLSQMETFELSPRVSAQSGFPTANIKVTVKDVDGPLLEGALVKVSSGAWTPSVRNTPHERHTGADGSATIAAELMSPSPVERFWITVSKPGYKEFQRVVAINNKSQKAVGTTIEIDPIGLNKAPAGTGAIEVKVTVLDSQTNNGVPDADVILEGPEYKTATTDTSGVVKLSVTKPGSYMVRLSQDNYWPTKDAEIDVRPGGDPPEPFRLIRKPRKDAAGDTIEVTVLAQEHADAKDKPRPLKNAWVSDGRQTTMTDAGGKATLRGAYAIDHAVTVTADNYEPSTQRVRIDRPMFSTATGRATFILKPALNDTTPIRLIVEVVDDLGRPVPRAGVEFFYQGRSLYSNETNEKGERDFRSSDTSVPLAELRKGITLDVSLGTKKVVVNRQVPADLLKPSIVATRFQVALIRDWSELRKAIEALEPKVFAWNKDLKADSNAAFQTFKDTASAAEERAKVLETEITALFLAISSVANGPSLCGQAAPYLIRIPNLATQVKQKEQELKQKIDRATVLAQTCSTLSDPELIRSHYRDAVRLLGEMGKLEKQAVADRNALLTVAKKNSDALGVTREAKRKLPELTKLQVLAEENLKTAMMRAQTQSDLSKTLISRQLTLKAEHSVLSVKAFSEVGVPDDLLERIAVMDGILNLKSKGSQAPELLPKSVEEAPVAIKNIEDKVARMIKALEKATCPVATLDDVVKGMGTIVFNSGIEIGLAADLPKLADACAAKAANKTTAPPIKPATTSAKSNDPIVVQNNPSTDDKQPVFDPPVDDKTVNDPSTVDKTVIDPPPGDKTTKTTKTNAPAKPNDPPTSSGGFWDTAKKSGKNVKDTITNKPTTGGNSTAANRDPKSGNKPNNKPTNTPLTVEDIPEDSSNTTTANNTNKPNTPLTVEDIPEDSSNSTANNRNKSNKPLTVEDIPEDSSNTTANNRNKSNKPLTVEEIPESAGGSGNNSASTNNSGNTALPPNVVQNNEGRLQPRDGYEWVNPNDPKDMRVKKKKKPRDPNKPDIWTQLGGAVREAITGQPNPGVTNNPGSGGGGGGGVSAAGLNLAGTWSVTTVSTGDDELQQNWTRTNVWHIWDLGGGRWRVRQVINGQTYDEVHTTVDYGGGSFRLISTFMGDTQEASGTYNQSQFQVSSSQGQNRITITGRRQ